MQNQGKCMAIWRLTVAVWKTLILQVPLLARDQLDGYKKRPQPSLKKQGAVVALTGVGCSGLFYPNQFTCCKYLIAKQFCTNNIRIEGRGRRMWTESCAQTLAGLPAAHRVKNR